MIEIFSLTNYLLFLVQLYLFFIIRASYTVAAQVGEFAVVLRAFVKGSLPFFDAGFEMFKIFVVDELLIYIRTVFSQ